MRLLFISTGTQVTNPTSGDQVRAWNLIKRLSDKGWDITILEQDGGNSDIDEANVVTFNQPVPDRLNDVNPFLYKELTSQFQKEVPDVIHVKTFSGIIASWAVSRAYQTSTKIVYDAQNFESQKITSDAKSLPPLKRVIAPTLIPSLEKIAVRAADQIVSVSDSDRRSFQSVLGVSDEKITAVPNGSNPVQTGEDLCSEFRSKHGISSKTSVLIFHGHYDYYPNEEAVQNIVNNVVPELKQQNEDFHVVIAGKGVPEFGNNDSVSGVGYVNNLDSFLAAGDIAIVPLASGGGTKLKVLDYMSAGLPIATTPKGAEGLDLENGVSAAIADMEGQEFIEQINSLVESPSKREELGANAQKLFNEKYEWNTIGADLDDLYRSLAET